MPSLLLQKLQNFHLFSEEKQLSVLPSHLSVARTPKIGMSARLCSLQRFWALVHPPQRKLRRAFKVLTSSLPMH